MMRKIPLLFSTGSLYVLDTAHCFELAAEAGFDGIEIMCDQRWSTRNPTYLNTLSTTYQLPIKVVHAPMLHISNALMGWSEVKTDRLGAEYAVRLAEAIQAEAIVVHLPAKVGLFHYRTPSRSGLLPWWRNPNGKEFAHWIQHTLPTYQQQTDVKICVENIPVEQFFGRTYNPFYWNTVDEWSTVAPFLTMDTTHWGTHGIDPLLAYRAAKDRVRHVHLSNYDGREHRLPHQGDLDLGTLLQEMSSDNYTGTLTLELYPDSLKYDDEKALKQNMKTSVDFCRQHLA